MRDHDASRFGQIGLSKLQSRFAGIDTLAGLPGERASSRNYKAVSQALIQPLDILLSNRSLTLLVSSASVVAPESSPLRFSRSIYHTVIFDASAYG